MRRGTGWSMVHSWLNPQIITNSIIVCCESQHNLYNANLRAESIKCDQNSHYLIIINISHIDETWKRY